MFEIPYVNQHILSSLIFCPLIGAILVAMLPRRVSREGAFTVALINFIFSLHLVAHWSNAPISQGRFRFEELGQWLPLFGINYHLGVDGLSVFLVLLTSFLTPLVILASWNGVVERAKEFTMLLLILSAAAIGAFMSLDLILFYIFFELTLVPTYMLIAGWGGARRTQAAMKFFIYTMGGSLLMWVAMLYLYFMQPVGTHSFDYAPMLEAARALDSGGNGVAMFLFLAFAAAFAIKAPIFPLHTWLPDAYTEAPTAATVMLAAVLSKMGIYGFLRFANPLFPETARSLAPIFIALAIVGIVYGALVAVAQTDIKRLLAYSSISHVSLIILGVFAALMAGRNAELARTGATLQMVNHGLSTGALFLLAGWLWERRRTLQTNAFGGLAQSMPLYTVLFWVALFASIGLPGLNGFVGEYLILQGAMSANFWYAFGGATGVVLGAIYMLRMFRTTMYGETTHEENRTVRDVNAREAFVMALILALIIWIGVAPQPFLGVIGGDSAQQNNIAQQNAMQQTMPELAQSDLSTR
jgi:NADH-quinone oxidoreductase subunit M